VKPIERTALRSSFLLVALLALGLACATSPTGRTQLKLYSDATMDQLGLQAFDGIKRETPIEKDPAVNRYVSCVTDALVAALDPAERTGWEVVVFADPTANAFALPGRKIGVHTGLLEVAKSQSQLAAVVGHEIGHVLADHSNERVSQQQMARAGMLIAASMTDPTTSSGQVTLAALGLGAQYGVLLPFSRTHESEADIIGLDLMARAGFEPRESVTLWQNMARASGGAGPPEWGSTHPSNQTRIAELRAHVPVADRLRDQARASGRRPDCGPKP